MAQERPSIRARGILATVFTLWVIVDGVRQPALSAAADSDSSRHASASSSEGAFTPDMAIDGDMTTRWSSAFADGQWFQIDFGRMIELREIVLVWEAAFARSYDVLVSENGSDWRKVHATEMGSGGREVLKLSEATRARYLKLDFRKRATEWGNSLFEILVNPSATPGSATASSGDGAYSAEKALDGDMTTRWSSNFADSEHWQVEFDEPRMICGLTVHWETAFGEVYNVEVEGPDGEFRRVFETADGDGLRDIIYFKPTLVKKLRLNGVQRGTGWGFSFWELVFHDGNNPPHLSSRTSKGSDPGAAMDGDVSSAWRSDGAGSAASGSVAGGNTASGPAASELAAVASVASDTAEILLQLPKRWDLGGLLLTWGNDYPVSYSVECSVNGSAWTKVYETNEGNGKEDRIFFSPTPATRIRIQCRKSAGSGFALAEIQIKGSEEKATPIKVYQAMAKDAAEGLYPLHLRRVQEFWTVVGVLDDDQECLLSENGLIEPYKDGFTVMPFLLDGSKMITFADCEVSQDLMDGILPIPGVTWNHPSVRLEIRAVCSGSPQRSWTAVRYRVTNSSSEPGGAGGTRKISLALAVLPVQLNPVWQHGGLSAIHSIGFAERDGMTTVSVNNAPRIISVKSPSRRGAVTQKEGGAVGRLAKGVFSLTLQDATRQDVVRPDVAESASDPDGLGSAVLVYDFELEAGASDEVVVVYPMHDASAFVVEADAAGFFERTLSERTGFWSDLLRRFTIDIPEPRLVDVMRTNVAYILINKDGPWIKPGPRNYNHSWIRDGAMTSVALLQMGLKDDVKQWIDAVTPHVAPSGTALAGMVPYIFFEGGKPVGFNSDDESGEGKEYDAQGQFAFAIRRYFDMTGDTRFLATVYPKVVQAMKFQSELRRKRLTPAYMSDPARKAYRGILPLSNSHEGYYPAMHSHWDNFWGLRGLKDGIHLAEVMGRSEDAAWMKKELEEFRAAVLSSIRTTIEESRIDYIPGCVEKADFDPTSTSIAIMVTGDVEYLPKDIVTKMYDRYFAEFAKGTEPGSERSFTPYEVRNSASFVRMGQRDRALTMLRWLAKDSVRPHAWNHMAEMVYARRRAPSYIGDMPHTWVGSGYISAVRTLFAYEEDKVLYVAAGIPREWFDKGVTVKGLPTLFGTLGFTIKPLDGGYEINLDGGIQPPEGVLIPLPPELRGWRITIDGKPAEAPDGLLRSIRAPARIVLRR